MIPISFDGNDMAKIAYFRVSTTEQSIDAQRHALGGGFDKEFSDEGVSGTVLANDRPGFSCLMSYIREGDSLHVYAIDRLGRDALDIQHTVRVLLNRGVVVHVVGLGTISLGVGELIVAVLAQMAQMERARIVQRCALGRETAKASLALTGRTHKGKLSLGRPRSGNANEVAGWRATNNATIAETAKHFSISQSTVLRYCADLELSS